MVALTDYQDRIHLNTPFPLPTNDQRQWHELLVTALDCLPDKRYTEKFSAGKPPTDKDLLRWLEAELSQRTPGHLDPTLEEALNTILLRWSGMKGRVEAKNLRRVSNTFPENDYPQAKTTALYLGDISELVVDATVNSALPDLAGCRIPLHGCLDSVIHMQAGPWLRNDGAEIMAAMGREARTGEAVITRGYRMPSRYIIHTIPPDVHGQTPTQKDEDLLRACYWNSLELAREKGDIRSIVFPALATGMNGFPSELAAKIALHTVDDWMRMHDGVIDLVLFSVRNDEDLITMGKVLRHWVMDA